MDFHPDKLETTVSDHMHAAVEIESVSFSYHFGAANGSVQVFDSLSLSLLSGQVTGIAGRNGSGKSTLFQLIRGALLPDTGAIRVHSKSVSHHGKSFVKPPVTLIAQKPSSSLCPSMTVFENYIFASKGRSPSIRWAIRGSEKQSCKTLLRQAEIGLESKLDEQVRFLSGGQQQALSVMLGLMGETPVLLMDEPTASLDPVSAEHVMELATQFGRQNGGTVAIVSHRLEELIQRCDRIAVIANGKARILSNNDDHWSVETLRSWM